MNDANDDPGVIPEGNQPGSSEPQNTPDGIQPNGNTPGNQNDGSQNPLQDPRNLTIARLKGQISTLTKKYVSGLRQNVPQTDPNSGDPNNGGGFSPDVLDAAWDLAEARVRRVLEKEVFPLYDGTDAEYKDEAKLPAEDVQRLRMNPLSFLSGETLKYLFTTTDVKRAIEVARLEIEQHIADRVEALGGTPSPNVQPQGNGNQVNPSPAPQSPGQPGEGGQPSKDDLWTMPMDQLGNLAGQARQDLLNRGQ